MEQVMSGVVSKVLGAAGLSAVLLAVGCARSNSQSLQAAIKQSGQKPESLAPLGGKVLVDGQPAHFVKPLKLVVMLYDPSKPNLPPSRRPCKECNPEGEFSFGTYLKGDGLPTGKFIATFAVLHVTMRGLRGPDELKNLYNDPDANAQMPQFTIEHRAPGKTDYVFELTLEGKQGLETPAPNALTQLPLNRK
jgi:hypothetical protein